MFGAPMAGSNYDVRFLVSQKTLAQRVFETAY
jgi:hypothetical protein